MASTTNMAEHDWEPRERPAPWWAHLLRWWL
jgi:hypothetical protein